MTHYSLLISDIFLSVNIVVIIELVIKNILNTLKKICNKVVIFLNQIETENKLKYTVLQY
jgi:hypothetical protein